MTDHVVHEAVGPSLEPGAAAACLAVGVNGLLVVGVLPILLGTLADEHRLAAAGIGQAATTELLAMGLVTAAFGMIKRPGRVRLIALAASIGLAAADLATMAASDAGVLAARATAGAMEGILLWISVSMIARTVTPERWAGVFFTAQTVAQLALAVAMALWLIPHWGANGGYGAMALVSLIAATPILVLPDSFAPLVADPGLGGAPPLRGWAALIATVIYVSAAGAVAVYLVPLAHQSGLGSGVARTAQWVNLAAQVAGGVAATAMAGRVRYFTVFLAASAIYLTAWFLVSRTLPAVPFVGVFAATGFAGLLIGAFLTPMTIDADPSRRAAMQGGAAQLLGGALGPLLASWAVSSRDAHGVLALGAALMVTGLTAIAGLRFTAGRFTARPPR